MDLAPTILDMASVTHPVPSGSATGTYRGRQIYGMRGRSWAKALAGRSLDFEDVDSLHGPQSAVGWELGGKAALRKGRWKVNSVAEVYARRPS